MGNETQVYENGKWIPKPTCPVCLATDHLYHCGRCNRPMVRLADGREYCPVCVPWERMYTGQGVTL